MPAPPNTPPLVAHHWQGTSVVLQVVDPTRTTGVTNEQLQAVTLRAIEAWNLACPDCSLPRITLLPMSRPAVVKADGTNLLMLRTGLWCPAGDRETLDCYDPGRAAITHVHPVPDQEGHLLAEADIELNAIHYRWSIHGDAPDTVSLEAIVLHGIGHFYGLLHSSSSNAVMYSQEVRPGKALPLVPTDEDVAALRALYPPRASALELVAYGLGGLLCLVGMAVLFRRRHAAQRAGSEISP